MTKEPFFICSDCGSNVLAIGHTWIRKTEFEQVGYVQEDGQYNFDKQEKIGEKEDDHEWIAYCGGCGKGVTVEWLSEGRIQLLIGNGS